MNFESNDFSIDFRFQLPLGLVESDVYTTHLEGTIWATDDQGENKEHVGEIKVYMLDVNKMLAEDRRLIDAFDESGHEICDFYEPLFDEDYDQTLEEGRPKPTQEDVLAQFKALDEKFSGRASHEDDSEHIGESTGDQFSPEPDYNGEEDLEEEDDFTEFLSSHVTDITGEVENLNILIIDEIAIKPKYRKHELGLTVLSYTIYKLHMGSGIVVMQPIPMQFYHNLPESINREYGLEEFEKDYQIAARKLTKYWSLLGFKKMANCSVLVLDPKEFEILRKRLWDDYPIE